MTDEIKKMKSDVQKMGKSSETLLKNVQVKRCFPTQGSAAEHIV
jgi:hypothetical protein